jgi:SAM-dependent methyltransferase
MDPKKSSDISGKDHYRLLYQNELELEAEWLRRNAVEKVNSIEKLLKRNGIIPKTILELGCGTGAVIQECQRRNLGTKYSAVDFAPEAIEYLREHIEGVEAIQGDITKPDFHIDDPIDLLVLSHVLEHLENPTEFLGAIRKSVIFKYAVIEVPLENLFYNRVKYLFMDRKINKSGHVRFFTMRTFEKLLRSCCLKIVDGRTYVPVLDMATIRFVSDKDGLSKYRYLLKVFINQYLLKLFMPLWKRLFYAHYTVLCNVD